VYAEEARALDARIHRALQRRRCSLPLCERRTLLTRPRIDSLPAQVLSTAGNLAAWKRNHQVFRRRPFNGIQEADGSIPFSSTTSLEIRRAAAPLTGIGPRP